MENYRLSESTAQALELLKKHEDFIKAVEEAARVILPEEEAATEYFEAFYTETNKTRYLIERLIGASVATAVSRHPGTGEL